MKKIETYLQLLMLLPIIVCAIIPTKAQMSGDLDSSFNGNGLIRSGFGFGDDRGNGVALQTDGKIVSVGGTNGQFGVVRYNADGSLDNSFGSGGKVLTIITSESQTTNVAIQNDGKIVVIGYVRNSTYDLAIIRYNSNGSLDTSFDTDGIVVASINTGDDLATALLIQPDGKIVVGGTTTTTHLGSVRSYGVARFNSDGAFDTSFDSDGKVLTSVIANTDRLTSMALQSDGKIVAVGWSGSPTVFSAVRYNTDGSLDTTFDGDGRVTTTVNTNPAAASVAIQSDGKIVVAGNASSSGNTDFALVRYNTNGSLDTTFDGDGRVTTPIGTGTDFATSVRVQSDGKIVASGGANMPTEDFAVIRYNSNGSLDTTFDTDGKATTNFGTAIDGLSSMAIQTDDKIIAFGYYTTSANLGDFAIARFNTNGSLDTTFDADGKQTTDVGDIGSIGYSVAVQTDNKIVVAGVAQIPGANKFAVVRFNGDGSLDNTFGTNGKAVIPVSSSSETAQAVAIQSDGKIVVGGIAIVGSNSVFAIARLNSDGSFDSSFDTDGIANTIIGSSSSVRSLTVQADGKIIAAGPAFITGNGNDFAVVRYNSDGTLDTSFDTDGIVTTNIETGNSGNDLANSVAVQPDGKILVGGNGVVSGGARFTVVRYNTNGSLDTSFDGDGKVTTIIGSLGGMELRSLKLQSDNKIVVAGRSVNGSNLDFALARYNPNGSLDTTFDTDGTVTTQIGTGNEIAYSLAIQNDGKIIAGGYSNNGTNDDFALVRYNEDGSLDTTFSLTNATYGFDSINFNYTSSFGGDGKLTIDFGAADIGYGIALDGNGKIVIAGQSGNNVGIARVLSELAPTSANADISGRVFDDLGIGLARVRVSLQNTQTGEIITTNSSSFGYFSFTNLPVGNVYIISVADGKRYVFKQNAQFIQLFDNVSDVNFIGIGL